MKRNRIRILGNQIDILTRDDIMTAIDHAVAISTPSVFAYTNIHTMNAAAHNPALREFLESADLNILDGKGVKLGAWLLGKRTGPALGITRLIWQILDHCERNNLSVYLLGSTDELIRTAASRLQMRYPNLVIAGYHHGYFAKEGKESDRILEEIAAARPAIVFIGFGTPLQDAWVARNRTAITAHVTMLVGGCFDVIAGKRHAAPLWVAGIGLEWLHRLLQEPLRLWQRYLIGIPLFLTRILTERMRGFLRLSRIPDERAADAIE